jgi:hypothetical protein
MVIFDLDNCLADDEWRIPFINKKAASDFDVWHKYHSLSFNDEHKNFDVYCDHKYGSFDKVAILTARPNFYRHITEHWLKINGIEYDYLMMRTNDMPSHILKMHMLTNLISVEKEPISALYDDREIIVEYYNKAGYPGVLLSIHDTPYP